MFLSFFVVFVYLHTHNKCVENRTLTIQDSIGKSSTKEISKGKFTNFNKLIFYSIGS